MKPGSNIRWWQTPFYAIVGLAKLAWSLITGKPWNSENR